MLALYSEGCGSFLNGKWDLNLSLWTTKDYDLSFNTENVVRDKELDTCWLQVRHPFSSFQNLWYQYMMSICFGDPGKELFQELGFNCYEIIIFLRAKCNYEILLKTKIYYSEIHCSSRLAELKTLYFQRVSNFIYFYINLGLYCLYCHTVF